MKKRLKKITTDKEAEKLLEDDISSYINEENFKEIHFEIQPKDKSITLRLSSQMLESFKKKAEKEGVNYQKLMRKALEAFLKKTA